MLDRSRHMLVTEISMARGIGEAAADYLLQRYLGKAGLKLPVCTVHHFLHASGD